MVKSSTRYVGCIYNPVYPRVSRFSVNAHAIVAMADEDATRGLFEMCKILGSRARENDESRRSVDSKRDEKQDWFDRVRGSAQAVGAQFRQVWGRDNHAFVSGSVNCRSGRGAVSVHPMAVPLGFGGTVHHYRPQFGGRVPMYGWTATGQASEPQRMPAGGPLPPRQQGAGGVGQRAMNEPCGAGRGGGGRREHFRSANRGRGRGVGPRPGRGRVPAGPGGPYGGVARPGWRQRLRVDPDDPADVYQPLELVGPPGQRRYERPALTSRRYYSAVERMRNNSRRYQYKQNRKAAYRAAVDDLAAEKARVADLQRRLEAAEAVAGRGGGNGDNPPGDGGNAPGSGGNEGGEGNGSGSGGGNPPGDGDDIPNSGAGEGNEGGGNGAEEAAVRGSDSATGAAQPPGPADSWGGAAADAEVLNPPPTASSGSAGLQPVRLAAAFDEAADEAAGDEAVGDGDKDGADKAPKPSEAPSVLRSGRVRIA